MLATRATDNAFHPVAIGDPDAASAALKRKLRQVSGFVTRFPSPQQLKFDLFFFSWWILDFLNKLRVSQLQFRRGHGTNFLVVRRATDSQKDKGQ